MNDEVTLTANHAVVLNTGTATMTADQLAAPMAYTAGLGKGLSGIKPGAGCVLWDVSWDNGSLVVFCSEIGLSPNFARLYESVFTKRRKRK
jgi:hypothetical protein